MKIAWEFWKAFLRSLGSRVRKYFFLTISTGFFWFLSETAFLVVLQVFLVSIGLVQQKDMALANYPHLVDWALPILIGFGAFRVFAGFSKSALIYLTQYQFLTEKREQTFSIGLAYAHLIPASRIAAVFGEIAYNASFLVNQMASLLTSSLILMLMSFAALWTAPQETVLAVFLLFILVLPLRILARRNGNAGRGALSEWNSLNDRLLTGIKNHFLLTIYRQTENEVNLGKKGLRQYFRHYLIFTNGLSLTSVYPTFAGVITIAIVSSFSRTHFHTDPAKLLSFLYLFMRMAQIASELQSIATNVRFNVSAFRDLQSFLSSAQTPAPNLRFDASPKSFGPVTSVEARDLVFGFSNNSLLFSGLSFSLVPGSRLAITGPSGRGKSTLLALLLGLLEPNKGDIYINGRESRTANDTLFNQIGYVGPEPFLVAGSVRENLLYGHPTPTLVPDLALQTALRDAAADDFVTSLPHSLDTVIGGQLPLSTGQRQRLSIARALLRNPQLLIFDEGTANLDHETEKIIFQNISKRFERAIFIFVTHNQSLVSHATEVLKL